MTQMQQTKQKKLIQILHQLSPYRSSSEWVSDWLIVVAKLPNSFKELYPNSEFEVINRDNFIRNLI